MPTYRERRATRAERLREWADKREATARALYSRGDPYRGDIAFNTQPGHIPERARVIAAQDRAFENWNKAASMNARADSIERAAAHAIYSDDPDAAERLREKIATLEAKRTAMVAANAAYRKAHRAELAAMNAYQRSQAVPHAGYELSNLGGTISAARKRLADIENPRLRMIYARFAGECATCGLPTVAGEVIAETAPRAWSHRACAEAGD